MWTKDNINEELKTVAPELIGLQTNPFGLPPGYFDSLTTNLVAFSVPEAIPALPVKQSIPLALPVGYFEGLAEGILNKIKTTAAQVHDQELADVAPILASMPKVNVYTVPAGYFNSLEIRRPAAKVVQMNSLRKVYRYAVAAVIFAIMAVGAFLFLDKPAVDQQGQTDTNIAAAVSTLSEKEIESYLQDQSIAEAAMPAIVIPDNEFDVKDEIRSLSEEELQIFLKHNAIPETSEKNNS